MSALVEWLLAHPRELLAVNLAAGCYALLVFLPALDLETALKSGWLRVAILVLLAVLGVPLLVALAIADALHRRGLYDPSRGGR